MTMRSYSALPLDDDIVDRIMTFCPTFGALQSTILVSKAFYRVFQTHPKSITRAVAYNIVGPALPQALRVIRYPYDKYETVEADPTSMATACPEDHDPSVITAEEKEELQRNSKVVEELEDIYSLTNKDRTSKTSLLTSEESWRFRRAIYRIMLFCNIFSSDVYDPDMIEDFDDEFVRKIRQQRTAVLSEYATDELQQLQSAVKFLRSLLESVSAPHSLTVDALLSTGPAGALRAWQGRSYEVLEDDIDFMLFDGDDDVKLFEGYLSLPLEEIRTARKIAPPKQEEPASAWILDQVNGANDTCSQCGAPGGLQLFTEANWSRFSVILPNLLKGNLKHNPSVTQPFYAATSHLVVSDALGPFIAELFDEASTEEGGEFENWKRDDSYCFACLTKFLEGRLWVWFLAERIKGGWVPPEDCWYGWDCRTQVHKQYHRDTKNHLCVPIRGDKP